MRITDTAQLLAAAKADYVSPLPQFEEADKLLGFMWANQLSTVSEMADEHGPFGTKVIMNGELLRSVAATLEAAIRHHSAIDEANAAIHYAQTTERPLTRALRSSLARVEQVMEEGGVR